MKKNSQAQSHTVIRVILILSGTVASGVSPMEVLQRLCSDLRPSPTLTFLPSVYKQLPPPPPSLPTNPTPYHDFQLALVMVPFMSVHNVSWKVVVYELLACSVFRFLLFGLMVGAASFILPIGAIIKYRCTCSQVYTTQCHIMISVIVANFQSTIF